MATRFRKLRTRNLKKRRALKTRKTKGGRGIFNFFEKKPQPSKEDFYHQRNISKENFVKERLEKQVAELREYVNQIQRLGLPADEYTNQKLKNIIRGTNKGFKSKDEFLKVAKGLIQDLQQ